jgi:release factor glutamine methyltransferase
VRIAEFIDQLKIKLQAVYDERESQNIATYLPEELFGKLFVRNNSELNDVQFLNLQSASTRLLNYEPIQYVLGEAWFYGKKFIVNPDVLIPRPETEELIEFILAENKKSNPVILDIGTGSGCIPIILKSELPDSTIFGIDISGKALLIAKENANRLHTEILFLQFDILHDKNPAVPPLDIVVSNPPYVDPLDASSLHKNILDHEPHLALFGNMDEPLIFYRIISEFAFTHLLPDGKLYFELPENKGDIISKIVLNTGLKNIKIKTDLQGKERMLSAEKN